MKTLIVCFFLYASSVAIAQNCKYKINEQDKFTGKLTKLTKSEKVIGTFYTTGEFSVQKIDEEYAFIFNYSLSSYSKFDPYSIKKGAPLILLLENGETITLNSADDINGEKKTTIGLPPVYSCLLTNVSYPVTKLQLELFAKSKVKSTRFYRTESNGKEDFIDNEIKKNNQDDIQNLVRCVL
ncbi:MAG: hypothetical protein AAB638_00895 [Patescibacteria group bacterium]